MALDYSGAQLSGAQLKGSLVFFGGVIFAEWSSKS